MTPDIEMPRYQCHKQVWALKIKEIEFLSEGGEIVELSGENDEAELAEVAYGMIAPAEDGYAPFRVDAAYVRKHLPQIGGYYVVYDDGYQSWSPAEAF
ncbi:MAG: hypothetical protein F6K42_25045, partial [Leptolyngbya sp. SIO1D8]|nr:hypothetical protein [Leptolyngbya sp. SIO1D8]